MTNAYIAGLQRWAAEQRAKRATEASKAAKADPLEALKQKIIGWYRSLPREARAEIYYMSDLQRLLGASPQNIGLALHTLAWTRRRIWKRGQPFRQTWRAPESWQNDSNTASQ